MIGFAKFDLAIGHTDGEIRWNDGSIHRFDNDHGVGRPHGWVGQEHEDEAENG